MTTTDEQIIRRLAEMMGWKLRLTSGGSLIATAHDGTARYLSGPIAILRSFDPINSESDARGCWHKLPAEFCAGAAHALAMAVCGEFIPTAGEDIYAVIAATPRQLCEAMWASLETER